MAGDWARCRGVTFVAVLDVLVLTCQVEAASFLGSCEAPQVELVLA